ncbi:MAG: hypothetical protein JWN12_70 [Candidatus Saccharibacteria bacterium]|nr:hypothetical protein [Candidatus Saccharibacteria bacterium]
MINAQFGVPEQYRNTFSPDQVDDYVVAAEQHYTPQLDYHNWEHAQDVMRGVDVIADKLEAQGVFIGRNALKIAAAWHDAGFHEDTPESFNSKEEYSAYLLDNFLEGKPVEAAVQRMLIRNPIVATFHRHPTHRMPAELVLHRADTANIGGPVEGFIEANIKLWHESSGISKEGWLRHVNQTARFIEFTAVEHDYESLIRNVELTDTSVDVNDELFSFAAARNIAALQEMTEAPIR